MTIVAVSSLSNAMVAVTAWQKFTAVSKVIYEIGQAVFLCLFGLKEIVWDAQTHIYFVPGYEKTSKLEQCLDWFFAKIAAFTAKMQQYGTIHGGLYIASGVASLGSTMQGFGWLPTTGAWSTLHPLGWGFFLGATVISLCHHIANCRAAIVNLTTCSPDDKPKWEHEKNSAILGIVNSLCYIIASSIALLGGPVVAIMVIGGLGALTGCIKILYDFYYDRMKEQQDSF